MLHPKHPSVLPHLLAAVLLLTAPIFASAEIPSLTESKQAANAGINAKTLRHLTELLENAVAQETIPNAAVYIWRDGKMAWSTEVGYQTLGEETPVDDKTIYRMFSMTKPVTAAAIMALVADGKLLLEDPISLYLPEFAEMQVLGQDEEGNPSRSPAQNPIRVRDLLTHTAGFTYDFIPSPLQKEYVALGIAPGNPIAEGKKQLSLQSMVQDLATLPLLHEPGYAWAYSVSLDVAGRLVEVVSGRDFGTFLQQRFFSPLNMKSADFSIPSRGQRRRSLTTLYSYVPDEQGDLKLVIADQPQESAWAQQPAVVSGGGGMLSSAKDYMKFAVMLLNKGMDPRKKKRVLSRRAVEILMADHMSPVYGLGPSNAFSTFTFLPAGNISGLGQGLGGAVQTNYARGTSPYSPGSYTWGGAAGTLFWVDPAEDMAVIFTTQVIPTTLDRPTDRLQQQVANLVYSALEPLDED